MTTPFDSAIALHPRQRAWAFSTVKTHQQCPALIKYRKIDRLPEPKAPAMQRGIDMHAAIEAAIRQKTALPPTHPYAHWNEVLGGVVSKHVAPEVKLAFNADWMPVEWMAPDVWLRVAFDAVTREPGVTDVWEWKTGKQYEEHEVQGRLYALAALLVVPQDRVNVRIRYLDHYPLRTDILGFSYADIPRLKDEFIKFSYDFLNDEIYPARAGPKCRYCHFRKSNGGPCTFG